MTALTAEGLTHAYGQHPALDDVSFALDHGVTALVGVNGAGKSTLLRTLAGAQQPEAGSVRISGHDPYARGRGRTKALRQVALMPQYATFPGGMTALEVVTHIGWMRGLAHREAGRRAADALERVDLGTRAGTPMKHLSGGMARRVALAQAIVSEPAVILLDEPSTGLDPEQRRLMVELVKDLDAVVLFSSHVLEDVGDVAERVIVVDAGRVLFDGHIEALARVGDEALTEGGDPSAADIEHGFLKLLAGSRSGAR